MLTPTPVVILGASGNALDILAILDALGPPWAAAGVLDDRREGESHLGDLPIIGNLSDARKLADVLFVNGVASERTYRRKLEIIAKTGLGAERFVTLIHPSATVSRRAVIGRGCCIGAGCAISAQIEVGAHTWIGNGSVIGHDCVIGEGATIAPSATLAGGVRLGAQAYVGSGALIRPDVTVGAGALIGMGAVVLNDVSAGAVVVGNPARPLEQPATDGSGNDQRCQRRVPIRCPTTLSQD